jgi:hypothetical protein
MSDPLHFLSLEGALIDRLRDQLADDVQVLSASEVADNRPAAAPGVLIVLDRYQPLERKGDVLPIQMTWLTVIQVRNTQTLRSGVGMRSVAGPLMSAVIAALHRWRPDIDGYMPLDLSPAPGALYEGGFAFFPLAWTTQVHIRGVSKPPGSSK